METISYTKYLRISSKKVRVLSKMLSGLSVQQALVKLPFIRNKAAGFLTKALHSAAANATQNRKMEESALRLKSIEIQKGPTLKRWNPVSRGMAHSIKKRTTHIKIVLDEFERKNNKTEKNVSKIKKILEKPTQLSENKKHNIKV